MQLNKYYSLFFMFTTILVMLIVCVKTRSRKNIDQFADNIEFSLDAPINTVCPQGEYCGNNISTNEIAPASSSNVITINKNAEMNNLNASGINVASHNLITMNSDGKRQIGSDDMTINLTDANNVVFEDRTIFKPENVMFTSDAVFMNNSYFKDKIDLDSRTSLCFFNDDKMNCLNNDDIKAVVNANVEDLDARNTVLRGACISTQSLDPEIYDISNDIFNLSPLDSGMKCITEASGVNKLEMWFEEKDALEDSTTTPTTAATPTTTTTPADDQN